MGKDVKINYTGFGTGHTKEYYRGKSFRYAGEWTAGVHYASDDYNVDFVSINNCLIACSKSHIATLSNKPSDFEKDGDTIIGLHSELWEFVISGTRGEEGKEGKPGDLYLPKYDRESHKLIWIRTNSDGCEDIVEDFDFQEYIVALIEEFSTGTDIKENSEIEKLVVTLDGVEYLIDREPLVTPEAPTITLNRTNENECIVTIEGDTKSQVKYCITKTNEDVSIGDWELYNEPITLHASIESEFTNYNIQTIAIRNGKTSGISSSNVILKRKLSNVILNIIDGDQYSEQLIIDVNTDNRYVPDIILYYTTDGTDPNETSAFLNEFSWTIIVSNTCTLKVKAVASEWASSDISSIDCVVKMIKTPLLWASPEDEYALERTFYAQSLTDGAELYYTLNDEDPKTSENRILYIEDDIENRKLTETTKVRICAEKEGWTTSENNSTFVVNKTFLRYGFSELADITPEVLYSFNGDKTIISIPTKDFEVEKPVEMELGYLWICVPSNWSVKTIRAGILPVPLKNNIQVIGNYNCYRSYNILTEGGTFNIN